MRNDENINVLEQTGDHAMKIGEYISCKLMANNIYHISIKVAGRDLVS